MACSIAFVAVACSLAVDTTGLSSGGSTELDASDATAAVDAPADTTNTGDAPVDARPDGPPARPCATSHTICEDFDDPGGGRSLTPILDSGGQIIDDSDHVSAPRSVVCRTGPSGGGQSSARLRAEFDRVPSRVRVAFDMKTSNLPASGFFEFLKLEMPNTFEGASIGYGDAAIAIAADKTKWNTYRFGHIDATTNFDEAHPMPALGDGAWHHVELDSKLSKNGGNLTVTVDGTKVVDAQGIRTLTEGATGLRLVIGLYTSGVGSAWDLRLDNVVADAD